ncbi:MAG: L-tyrosine/L-tryptophan isonitrile synthase family protein [Legionellales bacterium]
MKNKGIKQEQLGVYTSGLESRREAVISSHFMHNLNLNLNFNLYTLEEFSKKTLIINSQLIIDILLPALLDASHQFILERVVAAKVRAKANFKNYGLSFDKDIGCAEVITEVMFDRQFLKGSQSNCSRLNLVKKIRELVNNKRPIKMVVPALPYKSSSPLKSRGTMPDLSEVNFLLSLYEIAKTIDSIYCHELGHASESMALFTVISDGRRFNHFLNEADELIDNYQKQLCWWINTLQFSNYVQLLDYKNVVSSLLPEKMQLEKIKIRQNVREFYMGLILPLLNPYNMIQTMNKTIDLDPDPELCHPEGRFIPLFKSIIYIVNYPILLNYTKLHKKSYACLYRELTRHLFEPYTDLIENDFALIEQMISEPQRKDQPTQEQLFEYLRQSMLREAWNATIDYLAEIRSDRDLAQEPITACLPDHIRWTIHAKPGQLAILTTTAFGDPVQPWHGAGVFKLTKNNKIKLYTLPILSLEGLGAIPVMTGLQEESGLIKNQPLFYIHPDITFENSADLFKQIKQSITRKRKL